MSSAIVVYAGATAWQSVGLQVLVYPTTLLNSSDFDTIRDIMTDCLMQTIVCAGRVKQKTHQKRMHAA
ncbi:MAG: hypothetical protein PHG65_04265, partial [Kiritimatiellae bacterium]|nr:hypothetical protein [Kiritimatiellia bacterium]